MTSAVAMPKGLIFDMDGTIVDNMRFHDDAWEVWHGRHGLAFDKPSFFGRTAGRTNPEIIVELMPHLTPDEIEAMAEEKELVYREVYGPKVAALAGLEALMADADRAGVPMAVATAAPPGNVAIVLDTLGLRERFVTVVSPAMGYRGKPHPDLFLAAAEAMGVAPADCLVFEDAPLGVEAARRAGMDAIAILTSVADAAGFSDFPNLKACVRDFSEPPVAGLLRSAAA